MKKVLFTLCLLISVNFYSQTHIKNDVYEVTYSQAFQQPITLTYEYPNVREFNLNLNITQNGVGYPDVKTSNWKVPSNIVTSDKDDYSLPYHKGHLAPVASFESPEHQKFIYSYLNCAIMHKALNKGVWYTLENRERALAKEGHKVRVKVILSFSNESNTVDGGATIPSSFTKIIEYFKNSERTDIKYEVTREVYIFPNDDSVKGTNLNSYKLKLASGKFLTY